MLHGMADETRALSYIELAKLFGMTVPSARNMVRKRCWSRILSNDGKTVRVNVPLDALPPPPTKPANTAPGDAREGSPGEASAALTILAEHIEALQAELEPLRATAAQVAALNAALDAARVMHSGCAGSSMSWRRCRRRWLHCVLHSMQHGTSATACSPASIYASNAAGGSGWLAEALSREGA